MAILDVESHLLPYRRGDSTIPEGGGVDLTYDDVTVIVLPSEP